MAWGCISLQDARREAQQRDRWTLPRVIVSFLRSTPSVFRPALLVSQLSDGRQEFPFLLTLTFAIFRSFVLMITTPSGERGCFMRLCLAFS